MSIHRAGHAILLAFAFVLCVINAVLFRYGNNWILRLSLGLSVGLYATIVYFFRTPNPHLISNENLILSPAQGTIVAIEQVVESDILHTNRTKISIFLSLMDIHLSLAPIAGTIQSAVYKRGKFLPAMMDKASSQNEKQSILIETADGQQILVNLIAGIIARRILCYVEKGQSIQQGDELGFIRFGSRVDVYLPLDWQVQVEQSQHVKVGSTVLAERIRQ